MLSPFLREITYVSILRFTPLHRSLCGSQVPKRDSNEGFFFWIRNAHAITPYSLLLARLVSMCSTNKLLLVRIKLKLLSLTIISVDSTLESSSQ